LAVVYGLNHLDSFSDPAYYPLMGLLLLGVLVTSGFTPAALVYLADITEGHAEDRGSIMGLYSVFLGVGQLVGTAAGGRFATWKAIDGLLLLSVIFAAVTAVTLLALRRTEKPARIRTRG
jgi:predicted MFS family arabinose efflux permease